MTLALPDTRTPIFDQLIDEVLAEVLDLHFQTARRHLDDELDAHFASIPVDTAPAVIDAEIVDVVDTPDAAPAADIARDPIKFDVAMWLLAFAAAVGVIFYFYIVLGVA